jgi:hypothetical protein
VVCAVAAFAAVVSYSHIYGLGRAHGQDGTAARLLPLSVDGLILAASLVLLHEAPDRHLLPVTGLRRICLAKERLRHAYPGAGMLTTAAPSGTAGTAGTAGCYHGRWRRGRHAARE